VREICDCVLRFRDYVKDNIIYVLSISRHAALAAAEPTHPARRPYV